ncbi:glycosyltransferase family 2 protein [Pelagovum pacificum]|uniref:Glycosyltransferase n=1 Tax=Pelagovum pacificum TaxID=2588711 RepID=A0A5C5GDU2_9RHOB|nr:glycosyltransferase family 2 protein [Pelagovum pacificum]QQA44723.1 glycosyltransferase [Pelagovum pacificum]TNY32169.1 glycosyltransferase [Pelagovum pacificum]
MPDISIIIPCYNAEATVLDTLESLKRQTVTDWEAIFVDDGSTDGTEVLLRHAAEVDPRVRIVRNPGKGPSDARNFGAMRLAEGQLIAFCDADDLWRAGKLAEVRDAFHDPATDAVYGRIGFFRDTPADATVFSTVPEGALTIDMLLGENPVCTMSNITLRRDVFRASGGFDRTMVHNEDLEWLIRLVGTGARVRGLPLLQTWYRTSLGGLSTDLAAMREGRARALRTAVRFGVTPSGRSHAIHHRYLARRALRLGAPGRTALGHAIAGLVRSPSGFFSPVRRGALTLAASTIASLLPRSLRRALFC